MKDTYRQISKKSLYAGIGVAIVLSALIGWAFVASTHQTASNTAAATAARSDSEKAYENIVKNSLNVYHSRYSKYPSDYQSLLDDIAKSPDIYGVNDEGQSELKDISGWLISFSYTKISDSDYMFTYQEVNSGETVSVTNG
jgi:hypothetical protein